MQRALLTLIKDLSFIVNQQEVLNRVIFSELTPSLTLSSLMTSNSFYMLISSK